MARDLEIAGIATDLRRLQDSRLAEDDPNRLLQHRLQLELLDKPRRVYSVAAHMAISVRPRGVLAGELSF